MNPKFKEKYEAIKLRENGFSYSEILKQIPIAKSTLSLWLRSVSLSKKQEQRLSEKKRLSQIKGGETKRQQRILLTNKIYRESEEDVKSISKRELWFMGVMLYWAEGNKEKKHNVSQRVCFNNSDPLMIRIFLKWLKEVVNIKPEEIDFEIYIHENSKNSIPSVVKYWENTVEAKIKKIYFKKNKMTKYRKNTDSNYFGLLRVNVKRSTDLNRKISGWVEGICKNCGVV